MAQFFHFDNNARLQHLFYIYFKMGVKNKQYKINFELATYLQTRLQL
jgi:hypothetical protein